MCGDIGHRVAVIQRLEILLSHAWMTAAESNLRNLDVRIGGHVAFAGCQRMISGPEGDAAFRGNEHKPVIHANVPHRPWPPLRESAGEQHHRQTDTPSTN